MVKNILSYGAGVQSTCLLALSAFGLLPKIDVAIFSDTQWEPAEVYDHLAWSTEFAESHGIPVVKVTAGNLRDQFMDGFNNPDKRHVSIPLFVLQPDGSKGMMRRHCTTDYKIVPVETYIRREVLGIAPRKHAPRHVVVHHWFGISYDELSRGKKSRAKWKEHIFPFLGDLYHPPMLDKVWRRQDCIDWLKANFPDRVVPRSACIACPYHNNQEWARIREDPKSWADAVEFDRAIRKGDGMRGEAFVHRQCKPLEECDLRTEAEKGQPDFGWENECDGLCGI